MFYIFRWHRTQWVLAELTRHSRMGSPQSWLYAAATQSPPDIPPAGGWTRSGHSMASMPAPAIQVLTSARSSSRRSPGQEATSTENSSGNSAVTAPRTRGSSFVLGLPLVRLPSVLNNNTAVAEQRPVPDVRQGGLDQGTVDSAPTNVGCNRCSP